MIKSLKLEYSPEALKHNVQGEITADTAEGLRVAAETAASVNKPLIVNIDSNGGDAAPVVGLAGQLPGEVVTVVRKFAGSAAAVLFCLGTKRVMHPDAKLFFHALYGSVDGTPEDVRNYVEMMDEVNAKVREILTATGAPEEFVDSALATADGVTVTAQEALDLQIATEILTEEAEEEPAEAVENEDESEEEKKEDEPESEPVAMARLRQRLTVSTIRRPKNSSVDVAKMTPAELVSFLKKL